MTDLETAVANLDGHSICLCRNGEYFTDDRKGISPMMNFINSGKDLSGYSCADIIVGKAAAMLFVKAGITAVFGKVMSKGGAEVLEKYGIPFKYETLTDKIINRQGNDICPMEKTVESISDIEKAYLALKTKLDTMSKQ